MIVPTIKLGFTVVAGGCEHVSERAPGATLSRAAQKRAWLLRKRELLISAACGDWEERVAEVERALGEGAG